MLNVRLVGDHQYGKLLFPWLSLLSFLLSFFYEISWVRAWTELSQFLRIFLHTLFCLSSLSLLSPIWWFGTDLLQTPRF